MNKDKKYILVPCMTHSTHCTLLLCCTQYFCIQGKFWCLEENREETLTSEERRQRIRGVLYADATHDIDTYNEQISHLITNSG